jgi:hypothetical protein
LTSRDAIVVSDLARVPQVMIGCRASAQADPTALRVAYSPAIPFRRHAPAIAMLSMFTADMPERWG